jgi:hypothetical protein
MLDRRVWKNLCSLFFSSTRRVEANVGRFLSYDAYLITGPHNSIPTVTMPYLIGIVLKEAAFATSSFGAGIVATQYACVTNKSKRCKL